MNKQYQFTTSLLAAAMALVAGCNSDGANGLNSLLAFTDEVPGANCPMGGTKISSGVDSNSNGDLDAGEVISEDFICSTTALPFEGIVYGADASVFGMLELHRTNRDSIDATKVFAPMNGDSGDVSTFQLSPDKTMIAFRATEDGSHYELYIDALNDGKPPYKANSSLVTGGSVQDFEWAPDNSRIAYRADQETDNTVELYTTLPDGTGNIKINDSLAVGGDVFNYGWNSTATFIAYRADQDNDNDFELYTVQPTGNANMKVSGTLVAGGDVYNDFAWSADGARLAFRADKDTDGVIELYTTLPNDNSSAPRVNGNLVAGGSVSSGLVWAPDSSRIAYRADQDTDNLIELYTGLANGTGNVKISGIIIPPDGDVTSNITWAPDSSRVAYLADQELDGILELFTSLPTGGDNVKINGSLATSAEVQSYQWSADSLRLAYLADQETLDVLELYSGLADGSARVKMHADLAPAGDQDVVYYVWAPDGSRLAYIADQEADEQFELFTVLPDGTGNQKVNATLPATGTVSDFTWAPDSSRIGYIADQDLATVFELFTVLPDGTGNTKVNGPLTSGGNVSSFQW